MFIVFVFFYFAHCNKLDPYRNNQITNWRNRTNEKRTFISRCLFSAILLTQDYTQKHILTCFIPAFFIAGSISVFLTKELVLKYLQRHKQFNVIYCCFCIRCDSFGCSCTLLPLFEGIRKRSGIGPAYAFLFLSAINIRQYSLLRMWLAGCRFIALFIIDIAVYSGLFMA
jgi:uncharacterized membrane protein YraQ (UPF0718 family)